MATKDILIRTRPTGNPTIQFSGSAYSSIALEVLESGSVSFQGTSGSLFSISDSLVGSLMSVNDISGLPILEVFDTDKVVMGTFGQNTLVVTGSQIGIGTSVPSSQLHLYNTSNATLKIESTSTDPTIHWITGTDDWYTYVDQSQASNFVFQSEGSPRMVIETGGNVGIGTTNPIDLLHVHAGASGRTSFDSSTVAILEKNGSAALTIATPDANAGYIVFADASAAAPGYIGYSHATNAYSIHGKGNGSHIMTMNSSGYVGIGTQTVRALLDVVNGINNTNADSSNVMNVVGPNQTTNQANLAVTTNDGQAINLGGSIALGGRYSSTGQAHFAKIKAGKENSSSGEYGGYLGLFTRVHGGTLTEHIRIAPDGNVGIGMTDPSVSLQVASGWISGSDIRSADEVIARGGFTYDGTGKTYTYRSYSTSATAYWINIGRWDAAQGDRIKVSMVGQGGYNSTTSFNGELIFYGQMNNTNDLWGQWYTLGGSDNNMADAVMGEDNASNDFDIWVSVPTYYEAVVTVEISAGEFYPNSSTFQAGTPTGLTYQNKLILQMQRGYVGIGHPDPDEILHIRETSDNAVIKLEQDSADYQAFFRAENQGGAYINLGIADTADDYSYINTDGASFRFYDTSVEKFRITNGVITTPSFSSGFAGSGYQIASGSTTSATFDNLTVRGSMNIFELVVSQIKATNGALWISNTGKVDSVSGGPTYTLNFDVGGAAGHGFAAGDLIRAQRWDAASNDLYQSNLLVTAVASTGSLTATIDGGSDVPTAGMEYVRIGNTTSGSRQGALYLTADDNEAPYMDIIDGVTAFSEISGSGGAIKVRLGKLDGITDAGFGGAITGYGLYTENAYLKGNLSVSSSTALSLIANTIMIGNITGTANSALKLSNTGTDSTSGFFGYDSAGGEVIRLRLDGQHQLAGWDIVPGLIQYDSATGSMAMDANNKRIAIYTGSIETAKPKVVMGNLPTTGAEYYGFAVFSGSANADINDDTTYSVLITEDAARLAGWDLVPGRLKSGTVADINGNQASIALGTGATSATGTPTDGLFFVSASAQPVFYVGSTFSYVADVLTAGGWTIGNGEIVNGDIHMSSAKGAFYIESGSRTVVTMHTGSFDTSTVITELLGVDNDFETGTAGWTLSGGVSMSIARINMGDQAYSGDYAVTASDASGDPLHEPSSSVQYEKTGLTMAVGDVASYYMAVQWDQKTGLPLSTQAYLTLEGYNGGWSTLKTKTVSIPQRAWTMVNDSFAMDSAAYTRLRFTMALHGASKDYFTTYSHMYDSGSLAVYNGSNITELTEDGLLIFKDYDNVIKFDKDDASVTFNTATINTLNSVNVNSSTVNANSLIGPSSLTITTVTASMAPTIDILGAEGLESVAEDVFYSGSTVNVKAGTGGKSVEAAPAAAQTGSIGGHLNIFGGQGGEGGNTSGVGLSGGGGIGGDVNISSGMGGLDGLSLWNMNRVGYTTERSGNINLNVATKAGYSIFGLVEYGSINLSINDTQGLTVYTPDSDTDTPTVRVGIGTATPGFELHAYSADNTIAKFESSDDTAAIWIRDNDSTTYVGAAGSTSWIGATGALATTNLNIDTAGQIGIGSTNPAYTLDVVGTGKFSSFVGIGTNPGDSSCPFKITYAATAQPMLWLDNQSANDNYIYFQGDGTQDWAVGIDDGNAGNFTISKNNTGIGSGQKFVIEVGGNVGIGTTNPAENFHVYESNSTTTPGLLVENSNTGTTTIAGAEFKTHSTSWTVGNIGTDDSFGIANGSTLLTTTSKLSIDTSGNVTKPSNCAFLVTRITSDQTVTNGSTTNWIDFNNIEYDIGSDITISTDTEFTAPVDGKYQFNAVIRLNNISIAGYYILGIYANGTARRNSIRDYGHFGTGATAVTYWTQTLSTIEELDAGDTVKMRIYQNGGSGTTIASAVGYTSWSGYLLG